MYMYMCTYSIVLELTSISSPVYGLMIRRIISYT
jgi:hypothetical protein